ncbi:hypothetical protein ECTW15901_1188 [Escherichia coli TW15901]|nr:hypothetical protein ECTW15901_1188 [Escherichia coli TW15901]EKI25671.1 hypothetical protein ECTW00353_3342 [Escherichia coli TW00353]
MIHNIPGPARIHFSSVTIIQKLVVTNIRQYSLNNQSQ